MGLRKGMVVTVGTGTRVDSDIVTPLVKSIRDANADVVVLITTAESAANAAAIWERFGQGAPLWEEVRLGTSDEIGEAFQGCLGAIRSLLARGLPAEAITADYTSGTKTMTAAVVLAAVALRCGALRYIQGTRAHGVVVAGTERFLSTPPSAILAFQDLALAQELIGRLQFRAAVKLCESATMNPHLLTAEDRERRDALKHLALAYDAWDRFKHHEAKKLFEAIANLPAVPGELRVADDAVYKLGKIGAAVYKKDFTPELIADLVANARRRIVEERWDDAVARLYRATEMLAQRALKQWKIDTSNLDPERVPEALRSTFCREGGAPGERITIGLARQYALLEALGDPLAAGFADRERGVKHLLAERNESILAHGTRPVSEKAARAFCRGVETLATIQIPVFQQLAGDLQFPWVRSEPVEEPGRPGPAAAVGTRL